MNPAEFIRDAVTSLEECEADPGIVVNMNRFHFQGVDEDVCSVCLAGAWMDKRQGFTENAGTFAAAEEFEGECFALDEFRLGRVHSALRFLDRTPPAGLPPTVPMTNYTFAAEQCKADLRELADRIADVLA